MKKSLAIAMALLVITQSLFAAKQPSPDYGKVAMHLHLISLRVEILRTLKEILPMLPTNELNDISWGHPLLAQNLLLQEKRKEVVTNFDKHIPAFFLHKLLHGSDCLATKKLCAQIYAQHPIIDGLLAHKDPALKAALEKLHIS